MSTNVEAVKILDKAHLEAAQANKYNSKATRQEMMTRFEQVFDGKSLYDWQLNVTEALLLHLDCIVIVGTGAGKTMPFGMLLLLDKTNKKMVLVSVGTAVFVARMSSSRLIPSKDDSVSSSCGRTSFAGALASWA
jgi:hypothetical protein